MEHPIPPSTQTPPEDRRGKVAIIGAGFCGLGVAAGLQRAGLSYDQFEADDQLGGNWYHGVYETVHIISSRKTTEYTDWPMPSEWPDFPSKDQMLAYLNGYADHHKLRAHIAFKTAVTQVRPLGDGHAWELTLADGTRRLYESVVVANGHHWDRRMPDYPGTFDGELIHSKDYKTPDALKNKRVLVIGGGNSACDIAVEASRFARSAHISMRRGYWFLPKTMLGVPSVELMQPWMPLEAQRAMIQGLLKVVVGPYERYGLQHPDHKVFEKHPTINSELLYHLRHGRITPHPDLRGYEGRAVRFVDGRVEEFDLIVAATGYHVSFPFVAPEVVEWKPDGYPHLIQGLCPPKFRNIYFFGLGQPRYGAGPLISAGSDSLALLIQTQRKMKFPVGAVLERMGGKSPTTWLQDPHQTLRRLRMSGRILPRLPALETLLMGEDPLAKLFALRGLFAAA